MKRLLLLAIPLWLFGESVSLYDVPQMHCPLCTSAVKKSLKKLEGVEKVEVRLNTKQAQVWHTDGVTDVMLREAIAATGYTGVLISRKRLTSAGD